MAGMRTALTIAGSDSSGGAGIQADIKTMMANGVYAMSAITALTAQNTMGVEAIMEVTPEFLGKELDCVFLDIFPDAIKVGMVSSSGLIQVIEDKIRAYHGKNLVVDPVMVATSGSRLLEEGAIGQLEKLFPLARVITPNIPEAELLLGERIAGRKDMERAGESLGKKYGCGVLVKGGHALEDANDYLWEDGRGMWFQGERVDNPNTHGTGCTLSSAIASNLAKGKSLSQAVADAKGYLSRVLGAMLDLGRGSGPMNHGLFRDCSQSSDILSLGKCWK